MKFDRVYDFIASGPTGTKLTKIELALYYLAQIRSTQNREIRLAEVPPIGQYDTAIELAGNTEYIDFSYQDVLDFLTKHGSNLSPH